MGIFSKLQQRSADRRQAEEALYVMALEEVLADDIKPGLWAKAFAESEGDPSKAQAAYLKLRVQQMRDELQTIERVHARLRAEYGQDSVEDPEPTPSSTVVPPAEDRVSPSSGASDTADRAGNPSFQWVVACFLIVLAVAAMLASMGGHQTERRTPSALVLTEPAVIAPQAPRSGPSPALSKPAFQTIDGHALIPEDTTAVSTVGGLLEIVNDGDSTFGRHLTLEGTRLEVSNDLLSFVAISRHSGQDMVLLAEHCAGSSCAQLDLAWVRVFADGRSAVERTPEFRTGGDLLDHLQQSISRSGEWTSVALGLEKGAFVSATIGPLTALEVTRESVPIAPLSGEDCGIVKATLDECADFHMPCEPDDERVFPDNCPDASLSFGRTLAYLTDRTAGFNRPAFAAACIAASQLRMTPSATLIESEICSGADPHQWRATTTAE
jgi:hypothetical protein